MVKIDVKGFKSVELQRGGLTIRGRGHLNKAMQLITKEVTAIGSGQGSVAATYVHIRSREPWLSQAVGGSANRGEMHPGVPLPTGDLRSILLVSLNLQARGLMGGGVMCVSLPTAFFR